MVGIDDALCPVEEGGAVIIRSISITLYDGWIDMPSLVISTFILTIIIISSSGGGGGCGSGRGGSIQRSIP